MRWALLLYADTRCKRHSPHWSFRIDIELLLIVQFHYVLHVKINSSDVGHTLQRTNALLYYYTPILGIHKPFVFNADVRRSVEKKNLAHPHHKTAEV